MMLIGKILILILFLFQIVFAQSEDELKKAFQENIETEKAGSSIVMAEVSENGTKFINYGKLSHDASSVTADENTIYEIGSVTKVFIGILLAEAVKRGEVKLDDPISKYLPNTIPPLNFNGKEITLVDLTTQTSGLPRMPGNLKPQNPANPYLDYTAQNLYDFLASYKLNREVGTQYVYSNLGVGLLGHLLSLRAKMSLAELLKTRIFQPLGMNDSSLVFSAEKKSRHAQGFNEDYRPVSNWDFDVLAGAGAIHSTSADMAKFIAAGLGLMETPLADSFAESRKMLRQAQGPRVKIGLGWHSLNIFETEIFWHNGRTAGFSSYLAIAPSKKKGAFIVRNWGGGVGTEFIESVGLNSIEKQFQLRKPLPKKQGISLSAEVLEKYIGEYQLAPTFSITITREGGQLFAQATGQQKNEIFAEKEDEFFYKNIPASYTFTKDADGKINGLILHQNGQSRPAKKVK